MAIPGKQLLLSDLTQSVALEGYVKDLAMN